MKSKKRIFYILSIALIFVIGLILRFIAFLFSRPLWIDECLLFNNIYLKGFFDFFAPLFYFQSAPPIFLMLEKFVMHFYGIGEKALRLIPFLSSLISLPVFYVFSKKFLKTPLAVTIATALFAINANCIFYAQELKQYSTDILCFMILFIILNRISVANISKNDKLIYCLSTVLFPLFSLTSYFVIGSWFLRELFVGRKEIKNLLILQIPMLAVLYFYYTKVLYPQRFSILMISQDYWNLGFLSFEPIRDLHIIKAAILYFFIPCTFFITIAILLLLGIFLLCREYKQKENSLLINIFPIVILCSFLNMYPIIGRSILYMIPAIIVLAAKGFDLVSGTKKILSAIIVITYIVSFHNYNVDYFKKCFKSNIWFCRFLDKQYPNVKDAFNILKENYKNGDVVIITSMAQNEYNYYKKYYKFSPTKEITIGYMDDNKAPYYIGELDKLIEPNTNYWFFYVTDYSNDKSLQKGIDFYIKQNQALTPASGLAYLKSRK